MKHLSTLLLATGLLTTSCAQLPSDTLKGEWEAASILGQKVDAVPSERPFLGFKPKEKLLYGFTGCNRLTGHVDAADVVKGKADFSRLGMTRMLCHNSLEGPFLDALRKAEGATLVNDTTLSLTNREGTEVMRLHKK